jgi:hypothetical protein
MVKEGLGWRHFTSRDVPVVRRNPDPHPDPGRLWVGFVPKEGAGTSGQKGHVVFPLGLGKSLTENKPKSWNGFRPNTNAGYLKRPILLRWIGTIGPTTWSASPIKGLASTTASVCENQTLFDIDKRGVPTLEKVGLSKPKRGRFIRNRIFRRKPSLLVRKQKIDPICQKFKKTLFHLKNKRKYPNFERSSRFV